MLSLLYRATFTVLAATLMQTAAAQERLPLRVYAAGSLRTAMLEIGESFKKETGGIPISAEFGASGLMRERIEKGGQAEVFASADMGHPQKLVRDGRAGGVILFARNLLCAIAAPHITATPATLLDVLLDPKVRVGSSTPKNDPSGDYTWAMFQKAEKLHPGAFDTLSNKALKLVGGADAPEPPKDRSVYTMFMQNKQADVFITYCTNAIVAQKEMRGLTTVQLPEALAVGGDYGMAVLHNTRPVATQFALFIMSVRGQEILAKHGFAAPGLPMQP